MWHLTPLDSTATGRPCVCILWLGGVSCPVSVYCDGVGCCVLCLWHGVPVWQHIGQSTTATNRHRRDMTSDVSKRLKTPTNKQTNKQTISLLLYIYSFEQEISVPKPQHPDKQVIIGAGTYSKVQRHLAAIASGGPPPPPPPPSMQGGSSAPVPGGIGSHMSLPASGKQRHKA